MIYQIIPVVYILGIFLLSGMHSSAQDVYFTEKQGIYVYKNNRHINYSSEKNDWHTCYERNLKGTHNIDPIMC